jgi:7-carboxy-7-deazaguanine synthase
MSTDEIVAQVEEWDCRNVVVTGGEPMLHAELIPLTERLHQIGRHITIETAGTLYLPVVCDLMSISPKFANSNPSTVEHPHWSRRHDRERHRPDVVWRLITEYEYQLKFVIDAPADLEELANYLEELPAVALDRVLLMPQGTGAEELEARMAWLKPYCIDHGLVFCPRKQIEWFGAVRGT